MTNILQKILILSALIAVATAVACNAACGGNTATDCADSSATTPAATKCITCASGTVLDIGSGTTSATGGTCQSATSACLNNAGTAFSSTTTVGAGGWSGSATGASTTAPQLCGACDVTCATCTAAGAAACSTCATATPVMKIPTTGSTSCITAANCPSTGYILDSANSRCVQQGTYSTVSLTATAFAASANKVFDTTVAADLTAYGGYTAARFGPASTNATSIVYLINAAGGTLTKIASRTINNTLIGNTSDTGLGSVSGTDAVGTFTQSGSGWIWAVSPGQLAVAFTASDGVATNPCNQVYFGIYAAGGTGWLLSPKAITAYTCVASCSATGTGTAQVSYSNSVNSVWYDNSTYFIAYTSTKSTLTPGGTTLTCTPGASGATSATTVSANLQGIAASSSGTASWTTQPVISSAATTSSVACGPTNYTNSSTVYCVFQTGSYPTQVLTYATVALPAGTVTAGSTIATDSQSAAATSTTPQTSVAHSPAGFVYGKYISGLLIGQQNTSAPQTGSSTNTYALYFWNTTTGATPSLAASGITQTTNAGSISGEGYTYGSNGYEILAYYQTASGTTNTYSAVLAGFLGNGTSSLAQATIASSTGSTGGNSFLDGNGSLWYGGYTKGSAAGSSYSPNPSYIGAGYLGKVQVSQTYSGATVVTSIFAFLSFMIVALLAF